MRAVKTFNQRKKAELKEYMEIYKSKNPHQTSKMFFKNIEDSYLGYSIEELQNSESYLEDCLIFKDSKYNRNSILSNY